jgi:hypothetical protein
MVAESSNSRAAKGNDDLVSMVQNLQLTAEREGVFLT